MKLSFNLHSTQYKNVIIVIIFYLAILSLLLFSFYYERIPGGGWDGNNFIKWAIGGIKMILNHEINQYNFTRTFPSLIVGYTLRLFQISLSQENVKIGYNILNAFSILISLMFYLKICNFFKFQNAAKILGFFGLFLNFPILKLSMFYPTLTDSMAFMFGVLMIYYYLNNAQLTILFITILGAFTFPPLIIQGLLFFIFPYDKKNLIQIYEESRIIPLLFVFLYLVIVGVLFFLLPKELMHKAIDRIPSGINFQLIILSFAAISVYIFGTTKKVISFNYYHQYFLKYIYDKKLWYRTFLSILLISSVTFLTHKFASNSIGVNKYGFLSLLITSPLQNPFLFLLAHILYYGPILIIMIFSWKNVSAFCNSIGLAFNLNLLLFLFLSMQSESRMLISLYPIVLFGMVHVFNRINVPNSYLLYLLIISLFFSRIWFKVWVNITPGSYLEFPFQRYFMIMGPWMSNNMYYLQGIIVLLSIIPLYIFANNLQITKDLNKK